MKVYELYEDALGGISCYSRHCERIVYHVAATSVRQAYFLAGNEMWSNGWRVGILEMYDDLFGLWQDYKGNEYHNATYRSGQEFKGD